MLKESGEKLLQAESILLALTGSQGVEEMGEEHVQTLLVLCTSLVSDARASLPESLSELQACVRDRLALSAGMGQAMTTSAH